MIPAASRQTEPTTDLGVPWSAWADLGGADLRRVTVHANADGRQVVFGLAGSGTLLHNWQTAPSGPWSGWYAFGNPDDDASLTHVAAGVNSDGRLAVVAADSFGIVWYNAQVAPSQGWGAWVHVPGVMDVTTVAVARQRNGFLLLFANGGGTLSVCTQTPSGWTRWRALTSPTPGLAVETFAVGTNYDGRIEVAATFADNSVANIFQTTPNGSWSSWEWNAPFDTSDSLDGIAMARQEGGWLTTIVSGTSGDLFYRYQQAAGEATPSAIVWSQWARIANPAGVAVDRVTLAHDGDGRLQVFAIGSDLALWHLTQSAINVPRWNPWVSLGTAAGGGLAGQPAIGRNADGRLDAFVPTSAGSIGYVSQAQPTSRLAWFEALVAAVAPLVHLHPDELYMPASFDAYIGQTQYVDANGTQRGPLAPANLTWPAFGTGGYLTYAWVDPQIAFGDLAHAVCYAHVRSSTDWSLGGGYDLQYWFFYGFNGPGFLGLSATVPHIGTKSLQLDTAPAGDHEGDWEHITVRVAPGGGIERVYCSQHGSGTWYGPTTSTDEPNGYTLTPDGHPLVYAAQYGHPSYVWPGDFPTPDAAVEGDKWGMSFKAGLLNHAAPGHAWNCFEPERHQIVAIDLPGFESFASPWWLPYQGRCGMLKPSVGNTVVEASNHLATLLDQAGFGSLGTYILTKISYLIVNGIANIYPRFDDYAGPTAPREKGSWYTGL